MPVLPQPKSSYAAFLDTEKKIAANKVFKISFVIAVFRVIAGILQLKKTRLCKKHEVIDPYAKPKALVGLRGIIGIIDLIWSMNATHKKKIKK